MLLSFNGCLSSYFHKTRQSTKVNFSFLGHAICTTEVDNHMHGRGSRFFFWWIKQSWAPLQWGGWQPKLSVVQLAKFFFFNGLWALMNITCIARVKVGPKFFFFLVELIRKKINPHKFFYIIKKKNARKKWRLTKP